MRRNVAVVMYPIPTPTFNGYVDERIIDVRTQTGIEAPLDRVRERFVTRLAGPLGYPASLRQPPVRVPSDSVEALRASVTAPLVLDFGTRSWGLATGQSGGEAKADDPIYVHHFVRARLVRLSDGVVLWRAVCGLRGYRGRRARQALGSPGRRRRAASPEARRRRGPVRGRARRVLPGRGLTAGLGPPAAGAKPRRV